MAGSGSQDFNDWTSGEGSGSWSDCGSSMPSQILEHEAHKLTLREMDFHPGAICSPQQMQIVGCIIENTNQVLRSYTVNALRCTKMPRIKMAELEYPTRAAKVIMGLQS
jgi:hypothetical protein